MDLIKLLYLEGYNVYLNEHYVIHEASVNCVSRPFRDVI